MTVPMKSPFHNSSSAMPVVPRMSAHNASATIFAVTRTRPNTGKTVVRPVLLTIRPVNSEPVKMPMVSGTSRRPVCDGDAPRTTSR